MEGQGGGNDVFSNGVPSQNNLIHSHQPPYDLYKNHLASPSLSVIDRFLSSPLEMDINYHISQVQNNLNYNIEMPFSNFPSDHQLDPIHSNNFYFEDVAIGLDEMSEFVQGGLSDVNASDHIKGQWSMEEDRMLLSLVDKHGVGKWSRIALEMVGRRGKQCSDRWKNHLRPDIKKDRWTKEEENMLIEAHQLVGNKWSEIAKRIPGRSENSIKNHWNATKRKQSSKRMKNSVACKDSVLQDYIKTKILKQTKIDTSEKSTTANTSTTPSQIPSNISNSDNASISYEIRSLLSPSEDPNSLIQPTYDDELNFLQDLFRTNTDKATLVDDQENIVPPNQENMQNQENVDQEVAMQPMECNVSDILNGVYDTPYLDYCFNGSPYVDKSHRQQMTNHQNQISSSTGTREKDSYDMVRTDYKFPTF